MCIHDTLLIHSSVDGPLGCLNILGIVNSAAMNMDEQISLQDSTFGSFGYKPRSGLAGSYGNLIFYFLRNRHTVFYNSSTMLHPYQQRTRGSSLPHPCQHLLVSAVAAGHPNRCEVVCHSFHLHFPND